MVALKMLDRRFTKFRGGSRAAARSKMERFVIIVNGLRFILDVAAAIDPPQKLG